MPVSAPDSVGPAATALTRTPCGASSSVQHNRYYDNFRAFAEAIMRFFKTTLPHNWKSIRDT